MFAFDLPVQSRQLNVIMANKNINWKQNIKTFMYFFFFINIYFDYSEYLFATLLLNIRTKQFSDFILYKMVSFYESPS